MADEEDKKHKAGTASAGSKDKIKRLNQVIGAIAACMGGLSLGTMLGWASPAHDILMEDGFSTQEITHSSSIVCLGAAAVQPYMFLTFDRLGRKWSMVVLAIPIIIMYVLIGVISNWIVVIVGRFFLGFCGGGFCVAAPNYIGEYADKGIRGTLGIMFQLLLVIGIVASYGVGLFHDRYILNLPMVAPPLICIVMMVFLPESPVFLRMKKKDDKVKKALTFYRGKDYDLTQDIKDIDDYLKSGEGTFKENMKHRANINGFVILLILHSLQQLSGINAIMFYASEIFKGGSFLGLSASACTVILGIVQVLSCAVTAALVDKLGRKMLWLMSLGSMAICLVICGVYFIIKVYEEDFSKKIEFILVIALCIYIVGFCFGAGPLPWCMIGEMLSAGAKAATGPIITAVNWLLAYAVTVSFPYLNKAVGAGPVFLGFGAICILGFVFVLFFVIETKGKTLDEIQQELAKGKIK